MTIEAPRACILGDIAEASLHESFGSADVRSPALQTSHGRLKELIDLQNRNGIQHTIARLLSMLNMNPQILHGSPIHRSSILLQRRILLHTANEDRTERNNSLI